MLGSRSVMVMASLLALATTSALAACTPTPDVEVDGWALARAALVDGESCYAGRPEYCIDEPGLIDASIQAALDGRWKGEMPSMSRDVEQVIRSARIDYDRSSQTPEGLAKTEALVAAYYADPKVDASSDPELVNVDLGALPGRLAVQGRVDDTVLRESPLIDEFRWSGAEAGRVLGRYALAHPDKAVVRVELLIPKGSGSRPQVYRYFRERNQVVFGELLERSLHVSEPVPGGPEAMAAGKLELGRDHVKLCSPPRTPDDGDSEWCPVADRYGEAKREARREAEREARRAR